MTADMTSIETRDLTVRGSRDRPMDAYLALPAATTASAPAVLVIHEIHGLTDHIRDVTRRFASEGYAALALDLFSGDTRAFCLLRIFYGILVRPLTNGTVGDLRAAIDFLQGQPGVDSTRVGVIGFCMGGSYALQLACVDDDLRVSAVFYGQNPRPLEVVARACPIVGSYPEKDFTAGAARKLEDTLQRYAVPHDIKIYQGAHHSFFNDTRKNYDAAAAADAWTRTLAFFREHL